MAPASAEELRTCLRVLELAKSGELDETAALAVERAVADAYREGKRRRKARRAAESADHDRALLATARRHREELPPTAPAPADNNGSRSPGHLNTARRCYACREPYRVVDAEYHRLCPPCARLNTERRTARCDLHGRRAIVTGGRIKIGFHLALKMLRDGAEVLVTTRFPTDAARRFAEVPDFASWADRLQVHGVDLLDLRGVTDFLDRVRDRWRHLDILVNNAAQTVSRPPGYHRAVLRRRRACRARPRAPAGGGRPALPGRAHRRDRGAAGPAPYQQLGAARRRRHAAGVARGARGQRVRAVPAHRPGCARCWRRRRSRTGTSCRSPRWRAASAVPARPNAIRTRTWPRRRSTC